MDTTLVILFFTAVPIGIFGIVVGGNTILSFPIFQLLFPELTLGAIIGNIKPGSVVRNISSLIPLRNDVAFSKIKFLLAPLGLGSIAGALLVAEVSQSLVIPILILGFIVIEYADKIAQYITKQLYFLMTILVGMYGGVFGAGVSLLIVALLRIKNVDDVEIYKTRANALFLETFFTAMAVIVFIYYGLLIPSITITWALGAVFGGYLGGIILKWTGKLTGSTQKWILRLSFVFAITVALFRLL